MLPLIAIAAPVVGAVAVALTGEGSRGRARARTAWIAISALVTFLTVLALLPAVNRGETPEVRLGSVVPGLEIMFRVDAAGMIFALSATALWILASSYTLGYIYGAHEKRRTRFLTAFAVCVGATVGLAFSANLFTFFIFYELLTLATYPLVVHKQTPAAFAAGRRYLFTLLGGGTALLAAVALVHSRTPGTEFAAGGILPGDTSSLFVLIVIVLALLGFGTKAAVMPFHGWLPRAMVAPTPVSALLHAVAVVKAGVFGFVRMFGYVIGPDRVREVGAETALAVLAATTIVVASVIAFRQDELKKRLAYSTIAHLSYIVLGLSLASVAAWNGALLHLANHAVLKITLFFAAGAIYVTTGVDRVSQMDGIGRKMPFTMGAFAIASLGLAGIPPMGGFISKWFLGSGTIEAEQPILAVIVIGSGLLTAGYLLPIVHRAFLRSSDRFETRFTHRGDAAPAMLIPLCTTALIGIFLGVGDVFGLGTLSREVAHSVLGVIP